MDKEKLFYEAPTAQTFEMRFEGAILQASIANGATINDADFDDWGDIN